MATAQLRPYGTLRSASGTGTAGRQALDLGLRVGLAGRRDPIYAEPLVADGDDLVGAVVVPGCLTQPCGAPDVVERTDPIRTHLSTLPDRHHAELPGGPVR